MLILQMLDELSTENAKYVYYLGGDEVQGDILMDLRRRIGKAIDTLTQKKLPIKLKISIQMMLLIFWENFQRIRFG